MPSCIQKMTLKTRASALLNRAWKETQAAELVEMAFVVPLSEADVLRILVKMDFALHEHEVIRLDGNVRAAKDFHEAGHVAAGVDGPDDAARLEFADEIEQMFGNGRVFKLGEQGSVEVGG